MDTKWYIYTIS